MNSYIYFCSHKIFKQFNIEGEALAVHSHIIIKKESLFYIYPKDITSHTINPENFYNIKNELNFMSLVIVDHIDSKLNIVSVSDHINRTGKSFLRGKTPFRDLPTFPDISNIYIKNNGKTLMSVGEKNTLSINRPENVILSSWIAAISPVWYYVGVKIAGLGVSKNLSSVNEITKYLK